MKTRHLIKIMRCPGDHRTKCEKCEVLESCKELAGLSMCEVAAERLETLLKNLRDTEAELKEAREEARMWKRRHEHFISDIKSAIHEQEILDGLGGY